MAYTPVTNLLEYAQDELTPTQFSDKLVYQALLRSMTDEVQALEDLMSQMYSYRSLSRAEGVQLDNVGANLGVTRRLGQDDTKYRTAIFSEIYMRRSDGTADYIMTALKSLYKAPIVKIFEHNSAMTGGVVVVVNQPIVQESAVPVLKRMSPATIQSVIILRDPTEKGYAWTPVEVSQASSALVTSNEEWFITDGGLGVVVTTGSGQVASNKIASLGDPGFQTTHLGLDSSAGNSDSRLDIYAKGSDTLLLVDKETSVGGDYGIMAEVSQLRMGKTLIEGEQ